MGGGEVGSGVNTSTTVWTATAGSSERLAYGAADAGHLAVDLTNGYVITNTDGRNDYLFVLQVL